MSAPTLLASVRLLNGNRIELQQTAGGFASVLYMAEKPHPLTEEQAALMYRLWTQLGGEQHARFPG